jgi:hypothetical protein
MTDQLPAHLAARQRPTMLAAAISGLSRTRGPHVSIADNRFTLVDGNGAEKPIQTLYVDLVVVDVNPHVSRLYYDPTKPYNKDDNTPPLCFSDNGIGASQQASEPQNTNCQLCPKSAWNSAVSKMTGKGIPACAQRKKLAVIAGGTGEMVFDLTVPPASLGNWLAYCNILAQRGLEPYDVYTRVEFESQGVLKFSPAPIGDKGLCYVHEGVVALTEKLWANKATETATNKNDIVWTGQADAQKLAYASQTNGQLPPPAPQPAPVAPPPQPFGGGQAPSGPAAIPNPMQPFGKTPEGQQMAETISTAFGAPLVAANPFAQPGTSSPTDATQQPAVQASAAPKRGRGPNKPKPDAAPVPTGPAPQPFGGGAAASPAEDGIPPFLQRNAAPPTNNFGMQPNPPAPDAGIQAALDAAFRLPT